MDASLDLVDRYGLPLVILCLLVLGVWRVWKFVRPFAQEALEEHVKLRKDLRAGTRAASPRSANQSLAMSAHVEGVAARRRNRVLTCNFSRGSEGGSETRKVLQRLNTATQKCPAAPSP